MQIGIILVTFFSLWLASIINFDDYYKSITPEVKVKVFEEYFIKSKKENKFVWRSNSKYEFVYLTDGAETLKNFEIHEPYYSPMKNLDIRFRGKKFNRRYIHTKSATNEHIFYSSDKIHSFSIADAIQIGDTLSYSYEHKYCDIAIIAITNIPNYNYLDELVLKFNHDDNISVDFDFFFPKDSLEYTIERPNTNETILKFDKVKFYNFKEYYDYNHINAAILPIIMMNNDTLNPVSIEKYTKWYGSLTSLEPELDEIHKGILHDSLKYMNSNIGKLASINKYVRDNYSYHIDNREPYYFTPLPPSEMIEKKSGDCKDRAALVSAIAREEGISVKMAMVSIEPSPEFNGVHMNEFDHIICYYEDEQDSIFFDPTAKYCKFGNIPERLIGAKALILDPNNPRTQIINQSNNNYSIEMKITADIKHLDKAWVSMILRNDFLENMLMIYKGQSKNQMRQFLSEFLTSLFLKIKFESLNIVSINEDSALISSYIDISNFILYNKSEIQIPFEPFYLSIYPILMREHDNLPIHTDRLFKINLSARIRCSKFESKIDSLFVGKKDGKYFSSNINYSDSNTIVLKYDYNRPIKTFSGQQKKDAIEFARKYLEYKDSTFILFRR